MGIINIFANLMPTIFNFNYDVDTARAIFSQYDPSRVAKNSSYSHATMSSTFNDDYMHSDGLYVDIVHSIKRVLWTTGEPVESVLYNRKAKLKFNYTRNTQNRVALYNNKNSVEPYGSLWWEESQPIAENFYNCNAINKKINIIEGNASEIITDTTITNITLNTVSFEKYDNFNDGLTVGTDYNSSILGTINYRGTMGGQAEYDNILVFNFPVFETREEAENYVRTGYIPQPDTPPTVDEPDGYYYMQNVVKDADGYTYGTRYEFNMWGRKKSIYYDKNEDGTVNVHTVGGEPYQYKEDDGEWETTRTILHSSIARVTSWGTDGNNKTFTTLLTNIPYVPSDKFDAWLDDDYDDGNTSDVGEPTTGDPSKVRRPVRPITTQTSIGSHIYAMSIDNIRKLMAWIFSRSDSDWENGANAYSSPMDAMQSIQYTPIDATAFCNTYSTDVMFAGQIVGDGGRGVPEANYLLQGNKPNSVNLGSTLITGVYDDWRDVNYVNAELFLPFVGFVPLDLNIWLNNILTIEVDFAPTDCTLRYYLSCNGSIVSIYDGKCSTQYSLTTLDYSNKSSATRSAISQIASSLLTTAGSVASGNALGTIAGATNIASGIYNLTGSNNAKPSVVSSGCNAVDLSVNDTPQPYIVWTYRATRLENGATFGYPSNKFGSIGSESGYCICDNVILNHTVSTEIDDEIKSILADGFII